MGPSRRHPTQNSFKKSTPRVLSQATRILNRMTDRVNLAESGRSYIEIDKRPKVQENYT